MIAAGLGSILQALRLPDAAEFGARTTQLYALLVAVAAGFVIVVLLLLRRERGGWKPQPWSLQALAVGLIAMLVAGWPFWLTQLPVGLVYPNSRFTLPFMLGAVLLAAGLIGALPLKDWMRVVLVGLLAGFAVGYQYQAANAFRRDWNVQKMLFWQMSWRMPGIEPGTALLANDLPTRFTSDNSLSSPLNWIYAPDNHSERMAYILYYVSIRRETGLRGLAPGQPIEQDYLAATFYGSTSDVVSIYYQPPACLRVLDPVTDPVNKMLPQDVRSTAALSSWARIQNLPPQESHAPPEHIYGAEPPHGWCYYFEKADLARQLGDWQQVADLGDQAFALGDYPNDPAERLPFIEGYAQVQNWERALALTGETAAITPLMDAPLCGLWQRIDQTAPDSPEKAAAVGSARGQLNCK
jgi:hypothetical protein